MEEAEARISLLVKECGALVLSQESKGKLRIDVVNNGVNVVSCIFMQLIYLSVGVLVINL